jgi:hypothetical protein
MVTTKRLHCWSKAARGMATAVEIVHGSSETIDRIAQHNTILGLFGAIRLNLAARVSNTQFTPTCFKETPYSSIVSNFQTWLWYAPNVM